MKSAAHLKAEEVVRYATQSMRAEADRSKNLVPCPLCQNRVADLGGEIVCRSCGLTLKANAATEGFGGYRKLWNTRA